jgi:hypothetical protein
MNDKKLKAVSDIQRALGWIEGVSLALDEVHWQQVSDAVEQIEKSLEVLME